MKVNRVMYIFKLIKMNKRISKKMLGALVAVALLAGAVIVLKGGESQLTGQVRGKVKAKPSITAPAPTAPSFSSGSTNPLAALPDLSAHSFVLDSAGNVTVILKNLGAGAVPSNISPRIMTVVRNPNANAYAYSSETDIPSAIRAANSWVASTVIDRASLVLYGANYIVNVCIDTTVYGSNPSAYPTLNNLLTESNETNNCVEKTLSQIAGNLVSNHLPDLTIGSLSFNTTTNELSATLKNTGNGAIIQNFYAFVKVPSVNQTVVIGESAGGFAGLRTPHSVVNTMLSSDHTIRGEYYLNGAQGTVTVCLDQLPAGVLNAQQDGQDILEQNESNNCLTKTFGEISTDGSSSQGSAGAPSFNQGNLTPVTAPSSQNGGENGAYQGWGY